MNRHRRLGPIGAGALLVLVLAGVATAQGPEHVLVVVNADSADSVRVAEAYARRRAIPDAQVLRLNGLSAEAPETLERDIFESQIEAPIAGWLTRNGAQDRIHYIVLTTGIPLRVKGTGGRRGTVASVDSELTLLYRKLTGRPVVTIGPLPNPYFLADREIDEAEIFSHERLDLYLVTRLDGFTVEDALALIDRASAAVSDGRFVFDEKASWLVKGNEWLRAAARRLEAAGWGDRVVLEQTSQVVTDESEVLGYYSWGSNDPANRRRHFGFDYVPGALAAMFVSSDGRTLREPPEGWEIPDVAEPGKYHGGSPQSLMGDLIREGATGAAGHVGEPYLDGTIRPDILFPAYVAGFTLAEAFYLAMPYVSWQTIVVGDPLCAPFPRPASAETSLTPPVDGTTGLPAWFARRRIDQAAEGGVKREAVAQYIRAEALYAQGDRDGAIAALEAATALEPRLKSAQHQLAKEYEAQDAHDRAADRYREILRYAPLDAIALNNLAYHLAARVGDATSALPLARRAQTVSPESPAVLDTLGWTYFLLGEVDQATQLLESAARAAPQVAEIQLHLARALASAGRVAEARSALDAALAAEPALGEREDVRALRGQLP